MRITKKSGYGLIAMVELATRADDNYVSTTEISEKYDLPQPFLEKIMRELKAAELVSVKRGRGGGYELTVAPQQISVEDVILVLEEGSLAPVTCLKPGDSNDCHLEEQCPTFGVWQAIQEQFEETLQSFTLEDMTDYIDLEQ